MEDDFTAQAQYFVRSAVVCAVRLGLAFGGWCFGGCWVWLWHRDLHLRLLLRRCVFVTTLSQNGDLGGWECAQNVSKSFQTCGVVGAVLCAGFEVWKGNVAVTFGIGISAGVAWRR